MLSLITLGYQIFHTFYLNIETFCVKSFPPPKPFYPNHQWFVIPETKICETYLCVQPSLPPPETRQEAQYAKVFLSVENGLIVRSAPTQLPARR